MAVREESLLVARLRYNAAFSALQNCVRSNSAAPCTELLELEAKARRALTAARAKLLTAIAGLHSAYLVGCSDRIDDLCDDSNALWSLDQAEAGRGTRQDVPEGDLRSDGRTLYG